MAKWDASRAIGFDIETSGEDPAYALQPWRVNDDQAWMTTWATARGDTLARQGGHMPTKDEIRQMVQSWIDDDLVVCAWNATFEIAWLCAYGCEDLVHKVRWLDGMLLWRHLEVEPEWGMQKGKRRSFGLKQAVREYRPERAGYEEDIDFHDPDPGVRAKLLEYNKDDAELTVDITGELFERLAEDPRRLQAALIETAALSEVGSANYRGMCIDTVWCKALRADLQADASRLLAEMAPHGVSEKVLRSPKRLATLLFDEWKLPVLKTSPAGNRSTDKETLYELAAVDDRVLKLRQCREALGNVKKFAENPLVATETNNDGRAHALAKVFSTYCVPGDVEVLTRDGWVPIEQWHGGEIVQVDAETLQARFAHADRHDGGMVGDWVRWESTNGVCCDFTSGHSVPHWEQRGMWRVRTAGELAETGSQFTIPVGCHLEQPRPAFSPAQTQVLAMAQADGWFFRSETTGREGLKLTLAKPRKIERAKELLRQADIRFSENTYTLADGRTRTDIAVGIKSLPSWIGSWCKQFGPWVLDTPLDVLVDELVHWDGSRHRDGGVRFSTASEQTAQWAVTAAALAGRKATVHAPCQGIYTVHVGDGAPRRSVHPRRHISHVTQRREAYCPVTDTGFWLARSKGKVFVTGNSGRMTYDSSQGTGKAKQQIGWALHQEKRDKEYRNILVAPPGYTICEFDAAGQEYRWMAVASGDKTMQALCQPGEDPHAYMAAQIVGGDYQQIAYGAKHDDEQADKDRKLGKVANLSLQYRTSAKKLRTVARVQYGIPMEMPGAEKVRSTYLRTYPNVPKYWDVQIAQSKVRGFVSTMAGRRVQLPKIVRREDEWSMGSTAINYRIQGTGADQKYLAIAVLKPYMRKHGILFGFELHDGIYLYVPDEKVEKVVPEVLHILDNLPYKKAWGHTPPVPLPWDAKVGKSWGTLKEWEE